MVLYEFGVPGLVFCMSGLVIWMSALVFCMTGRSAVCPTYILDVRTYICVSDLYFACLYLCSDVWPFILGVWDCDSIIL